jgi:DNA-binding transcriptional ArsR family regulator
MQGWVVGLFAANISCITPTTSRCAVAVGAHRAAALAAMKCVVAVARRAPAILPSVRARACRRMEHHHIRRWPPVGRVWKKLAFSYTLGCNIDVNQLTDVLTAISHPSRRAIIEQLSAGPARFTDIAKPFDTALNSVTKHLKLLERAGLIERRKQGREVFISFRGEPLRQVAGWVHEYERFWNTHLDQFEGYFTRKKQKKQQEKKP